MRARKEFLWVSNVSDCHPAFRINNSSELAHGNVVVDYEDN